MVTNNNWDELWYYKSNVVLLKNVNRNTINIWSRLNCRLATGSTDEQNLENRIAQDVRGRLQLWERSLLWSVGWSWPKSGKELWIIKENLLFLSSEGLSDEQGKEFCLKGRIFSRKYTDYLMTKAFNFFVLCMSWLCTFRSFIGWPQEQGALWNKIFLMC